jgi:hypothetical protein
MLIGREPLKDELPQVSVLSLVPLQRNVKKPDADIGHNGQHQSEKNQAETGKKAIRRYAVQASEAFHVNKIPHKSVLLIIELFPLQSNFNITC